MLIVDAQVHIWAADEQGVTMFTEELPWLTGEELSWIMGPRVCELLGWRDQALRIGNRFVALLFAMTTCAFCRDIRAV